MLARVEDLSLKASNDDNGQVRVVRTATPLRRAMRLLAAGAMVLPLLAGIFLLTTEAFSKPDTLSLAFAQPMATLQIVAGLLLLAALVLVPARRLIAQVGCAGRIEIGGGEVRVSERGLLAGRAFQEPLAAYGGVVHQMRTTISGVRHELRLVHPDARRDVVLALDLAEPALSPERMIARLGLPEITVRDIRRAR